MDYILDIDALMAALANLMLNITNKSDTMEIDHKSGTMTPDDMETDPKSGTTTPDTLMRMATPFDDALMELGTPDDTHLEMSSSSEPSTPNSNDFEICSISGTNTFSFDITSFNDRSPETRDARMANSILALDEDIPMDVDDSIKTLLYNNTDTTSSTMDYLDYKETMAEKKATTPALPKSKAHQARKAAELGSNSNHDKVAVPQALLYRHIISSSKTGPSMSKL